MLLCMAFITSSKASPWINKISLEGVNFEVKITGDDLKDDTTAMETSWQFAESFMEEYYKNLDIPTDVLDKYEKLIAQPISLAADGAICVGGVLVAAPTLGGSIVACGPIILDIAPDLVTNIMDFLNPNDSVPQEIRDAHKELASASAPACLKDPVCDAKELRLTIKFGAFKVFYDELQQAEKDSKYVKGSNQDIIITARSPPYPMQWGYRIVNTNEYWDTATAGTASCTPGSASKSCDTSDSCVSCSSTCYKPGTYDFSNGKFICSDGKWKQGTPSGYPRTNEYWDTSIAACTPGSVQATCPSQDSCVGCNGKCYAPGSKPDPDVICNGGKWDRPQNSGGSSTPSPSNPGQNVPRTNEYWPGSAPSSCEPGSAHAMCKSSNSCVDCTGQCYSEGHYTSKKGNSMDCSQGKWTIGSSGSKVVPICSGGCHLENRVCICPELPSEPKKCPTGYYWDASYGKCFENP